MSRMMPSSLQLVRVGSQSKIKLTPTVATIGNFDGLHKGHQLLLEKVRQKAQALQATPTVITFHPMPQRLLRPQTPLLRLSTFSQKLRLLADFGIKQVIALRFDHSLYQLGAQEFIDQYLVDKFQVQHLVVGENFHFGHQQAGDIKLLQAQASKGALTCEVVQLDHAPVSSTAIRQLLLAGNCAQAASLLGRPFSFSERVVRGKGLATQWGIPTANMPIKVSEPQFKGIFVIQAFIDEKIYFGVANLGTRPTMDGKHYLLEAHLFEYSGNLYGKRIHVELLHKLRDEIRFPSLDALRMQIDQDILDAKQFIKAGLA